MIMKAIYNKPLRMFLIAALVAAAFTNRSAAQETFTESSKAAGAVTIDVAAYAKLCGRWEYRRTEYGETNYWSKEILGTRIRAGKPVYLLASYDEDGDPNDQDFLSADLSRGLYLTGGLNDNGQPSEETFTWKPAVPQLMKVFKPGVWYSSEHVLSNFKGVLKHKMKTERDSIKVPYGNLDCYKVTHSYSQNGKVLNDSSYWYAKNLGQVKKVGEGSVRELASYQPAPWLIMEQPAKSALFDGVGKKSFGTRSVGKAGVKKTFTVRNLGTKALAGLSISKNGSHAGDFTVSAPVSAKLGPGKATTFSVTFAPKSKGSRKAAIHISHTESKSNPFDIQLTGMGAK